MTKRRGQSSFPGVKVSNGLLWAKGSCIYIEVVGALRVNPQCCHKTNRHTHTRTQTHTKGRTKGHTHDTQLQGNELWHMSMDSHYGAETWTIRKEDVIQIEVFEMWIMEKDGEDKLDRAEN